MPRVTAALFVVLSTLAGCETTPAPGPDAARSDDAFVPAEDGASLDALTPSDDAPVLTDTPSSDDATTSADARSGSCAAAIASIEAAATSVWFLSESDRPMTIRIFAGEGVSAPTEATVVRLASPPPGATSEIRMTDRFARGFEPAPGASAEAPAMLEAAIAAGLNDLLYVAIIDPAAPAEVRVILAGRTSCGELVLVESVSIET